MTYNKITYFNNIVYLIYFTNTRVPINLCKLLVSSF